MPDYYAGIGSRKTPFSIWKEMTAFADEMQKDGLILNSGGAPGADMAFQKGANGKMQIFLPKDGFNGHKVDNIKFYCLNLPEAERIAREFHPAWHKLREDGRLFHTRNVYQVLGKDLCTPVKFVKCWTKDGKASGGTGQAMRIADAYGIPIFNMNEN